MGPMVVSPKNHIQISFVSSLSFPENGFSEYNPGP